VPALRASHLEAGLGDAALVDLIRSLTGLALDLEHVYTEAITVLKHTKKA
jgi:hypothetical protein